LIREVLMKWVLIALIALIVAIVPPVSAAPPVQSVTGNITLDTFGNSITISARKDAEGVVSGFAILESGLGVRGQSHVRIRIELTCLEVTGSIALVGGSTVAASPSVGTIFPEYGFVLQDNGPGVPDQSTIFALFASVLSNPCLDIFPPAVETALRGNIIVK
jgi:hypothetical protein